MNFGPGTVDPNVAAAPIGVDGKVCFVNSVHSDVHVIADHLGTIDGETRSRSRPRRVRLTARSTPARTSRVGAQSVRRKRWRTPTGFGPLPACMM